MVFRYLFWQEVGGILQRISLATHKKLTLEMRVWPHSSTIKLDYVNKQVYGFAHTGDEFYISASDYDGGNQRKITSAQFWIDIFGVFNGLLYFNDRSYIKEMNLSNRNYIRSIAVDRNDYLDLIVVHKSLQPLGKL